MALSPSPATVDSSDSAHTIGGHGGKIVPLDSGGGSGGTSGGGQSGGSGGVPSPPVIYVSGPGITTDPTGALIGVVGGQVNVLATPGNQTEQSGPLVAVSYSVSGALSGQNYSWTEGISPQTTGQTVQPTNGAVPNYDFLEDETTGNHPITVKAIYQNESVRHQLSTWTWSNRPCRSSRVAQPFTLGTMVYPTAVWPPMGEGYASPGVKFDAEVNNGTPFCGSFWRSFN